MYLKRLYRHNKILFRVIILLTGFQAVNNIRQDVSFSPVYTYGMYSKLIQPANTYTIPEIIVNGKMLQTKDFTPQRWDKIIQPVILFSKQQEWNHYLFESYIQRLLRVSDSTNYINHLSSSQFNEWFRQYLESILHYHISMLAIHFSVYNLNGGKLVKVRPPETAPAL